VYRVAHIKIWAFLFPIILIYHFTLGNYEESMKETFIFAQGNLRLLPVHRPPAGGFYIEDVRAGSGNVYCFLPPVVALHVGEHINK
jgi:hypothetical protein